MIPGLPIGGVVVSESGESLVLAPDGWQEWGGAKSPGVVVRDDWFQELKRRTNK